MFNPEPLPQKPFLYHALTLAYMGDAVFEIYVRQHLLSRGLLKAHELHKAATRFVSAKAQARMMNHLLEEGQLSEREQEIARRGRNAKPATVPKHTPISTYHMSTAFESVLGYLFLDKQTERLEELITYSLSIIDRNEGQRNEGED